MNAETHAQRWQTFGLPALVESRQHLAHGQRALDGVARVFRVVERGAEDREDGVADEVVDHAATGEDRRRHRVEVLGQARRHLFGRHALGQRGEAAQVREEDGDLAALAGEARRVALDAGRDLGADVAAQSVAQPSPRQDVGADAEERGHADRQEKVHPVTAAAEGQVARGNA